MRHDVIPPLSDCVQLSVEQYRSKLYDIIRAEKAVRKKSETGGDNKVNERRASSHELRDKSRDHERHGDHHQLRSDVVRKVASEVNMRGQSASDNHLGGRSLQAKRMSASGLRSFEDQRQSLRETLKQGITNGYCYRTTANFIKNKS